MKRFSGCDWYVLAAAMTGSALLAVALGQDTNWDLRNYHYYAGYALLHKPLNYDFAAAQLQSFFNPLTCVLPYLMLAHLPAALAAAALGAIQGVNFCLIFLISQALFRRWRNPYRFVISLGNAAAGFYGAANISELGATFGDNLVSILTLAGLLLVLYFLASENTRRQGSVVILSLAAFSLGAATGLKLTLGIYAAAAAIGLMLTLRANRVRSLAVFSGALVAGFIAAYGFWGVHLYLQYQNPTFPHLNGLFRSPYYDTVSPFDDRFLPRTWHQTLFYPFFFARKNHLVSEIDFRDVRLAFCYAAMIVLGGVILANLFRRRRSIPMHGFAPDEKRCFWFLVSALGLSYILWQHFFSIYRYQIVLEFLAPTCLAIVLNYVLTTRRLVLAMSLALDIVICLSVIPPDWGRQKFDDHLLKVQVPPIHGLADSVVLMAGGEATAYIVPSFPEATRFVRVFSNLVRPMQNARVDGMIRAILAKYDPPHTLVYVTNPDELEHTRHATSHFGVHLDDSACFEVTSGGANRGYLCRVAGGWAAGENKPPSPPWNHPEFRKDPGVRFEATPPEVRAGEDSICYRVIGMKAGALDLLFDIDGQPMPPVRGWPLDSSQSARIFAGMMTMKGLYHITAIRSSGAPGPNVWIPVDSWMRVK